MGDILRGTGLAGRECAIERGIGSSGHENIIKHTIDRRNDISSNETPASSSTSAVQTGRRSICWLNESLHDEVGYISQLLLRHGATHDETLPLVAKKLMEMYLLPHESGRASVWMLAPDRGSFCIAATSAQGDAEKHASIHETLSLDHLFFLRSLMRGGYGLFNSKQQIYDLHIPNKPGYSSLMYAVCIHRGVMIGLVGVGRMDDVAVSNAWQRHHVTALNSVADMLAMPLLQVPSVNRDQHKKDTYFDLAIYRSVPQTAESGSHEIFHERISKILGITAERLGPRVLRRVSAWRYNDGSYILYPGRRIQTKDKANGFEETPLDAVEVIGDSVDNTLISCALSRVDYLIMDNSDKILFSDEWESKLKKLMLLDLEKSKNHDERFKFHGNYYSAVSQTFRQNSMKTLEKPGDKVMLMPVMYKGKLHSSLSFVIAENNSDIEKNQADVLHHGLHARKMLLAAIHEESILRSSQHLPDVKPLITEVRAGKAVALVGAGFSVPAGLVSWFELLDSMLVSAKDTGKINEEQSDYMREVLETKTAESFDKTAQLLESYLGAEWVQDKITKILMVDFPSMPRAMQRRVRIFNDIPWRAVLTTNYDLCFKGLTPNCDHIGSVYETALRAGFLSIGERLTATLPSTPVVKLHGCVEKGNIVFTRSGYRRLLYKDFGYQVFLKSLMASYTMVSLGHSGTDNYINEFRSEALTMFGGKTNTPLGYSVAPVSDGEASFSRDHDGIAFLSWDVDHDGWGIFDQILERLRKATSPHARMHTMLQGRRILLVDSPHSRPKGGWQLIDLAITLFQILPSAIIHLLESSDGLKATVAQAASDVAPYDVILQVFDEYSTHLELEAHRKSALDYDLPFAVIESDSQENQRGITALRGCDRVVCSIADTAEYLFQLFEQNMLLHGFDSSEN